MPVMAPLITSVEPALTWKTPSAPSATTGTSMLALPPPVTSTAPLVRVKVVGVRPDTASMVKPPPLILSALIVCDVGTVLVVAVVATNVSVADALATSVTGE